MSRVAIAIARRGAGALGAALLAVAALPAAAEEPARVVSRRTGAHADFDRVVIELDREVEVLRLPAERGGVELQIAAEPLRPIDALGAVGSRMGLVELRGGPEGTRVRVPARPRAVRVFRLREPPRVVIDLGAPGVASLDLAPGVEALPEPEPAPPEPSEPEGEVALSQSEGVPPEPDADAPPGPEVAPTPPDVAPIEPQGAPTPPQTARTRPEAAAGASTEPQRQPQPPPPGATEPAEPGAGWLSVLVWVGVFATVGAMGGWALLRRRSGAYAVAEELDLEPGSERSITRAELAYSADRMDALEKRVDAEARARVQLEERLAQAQEDLKVLRDRLHRAARGARSE